MENDPLEDDRSFPQRATKPAIFTANPTTEQTQRAAGPNFFKDGENVPFMRAQSVVSCSFDSGTLRLTLRTQHLWNRTSQTHDSVMHQFITEEGSFGEMHVDIAFFTDEIFRIKFAGSRTTLDALADDPAFPPPEARMLIGNPHTVTTDFAREGGFVSISSPSVRVLACVNPFRLKAFKRSSKTPFWKQRLSDMFTSDVIPTSLTSFQGRHATFEAFTLDPDESIYGLGERFDAVERRGRHVDFVNHDVIGTSNTRSYINVPFFWSTSGYGCFVNSVARTEWDVGATEAGTLGFCTEEKHMDYFIIEGTTPKEIIRKYTQDLTGTSPVPPVWTFGLWLSRNSYQSWHVVDEVIQTADKHRMPFDTVHLDTAWFHEDWNPDLLFCKERFAEPEKKMGELAERGIHVSLWQYNFVPPREDNCLYRESHDTDMVGKARHGDGSRDASKNFEYPPGTTGWRVDDLVIDLSNPTAAAWYCEKISRLISQGASAIKTDFADCIPPDASYLNIEGRRFQNLYSLVYNAAIRKAVAKVNTNTGQWARSGTAGSQRYPVHWGGDSQCSWSALQGSLRATLTMGMSGFTFFSHDLGGFIGQPSPELYIRWAQLALMSSHARSHGAGNDNGREPWFFGDEAITVVRKFASLRYVRDAKQGSTGFRICLVQPLTDAARYRLLPYILEQAHASAKAGHGLVRPIVLEYPGDHNVREIETQYFLGSDMLVAPILKPVEDAESQDVYLPAGVWFDFWTKEKILSTGQWIVVSTTSLDVMPMWVRCGATLLWAVDRLRTYNITGEIEQVELYGDQDGPVKVGDGMNGKVEIVRNGEGQWTCVSHDAAVTHFV